MSLNLNCDNQWTVPFSGVFRTHSNIYEYVSAFADILNDELPLDLNLGLHVILILFFKSSCHEKHERLRDRCLKTGVSKIIAHVIQHANFHHYRAYFAEGILKNPEIMTNMRASFIKRCFFINLLRLTTLQAHTCSCFNLRI